MKKALFASISLLLGATLAHAQATPPAGYVSLDQYESGKPADPKHGAAVKFDVKRGTSLRVTLERWASLAGWQPLSWKLPEDTDFTLGADGHFEGDFVTATKAFLDSLGAEAQLRVVFNQGNHVAVVEPLQ